MSLPNEVLSLVLTPSLYVPDEKFASTSSESPFSLSPRSSNLLLVSKSWLRVATPFLYAVVVLRSKEQARALERTLQSNADLGRFVKKLRLEGGYGMSLKSILARIPRVEDLFLSLNIWTFDNVAGLCQGLHLVNPRRVLVYDERASTARGERHTSNFYIAASTRLAKKIASCIIDWTNLRVVELPWVQEWPEGDQDRALRPIWASVKSVALDKLVVPRFVFSNMILPPRYLEPMFNGDPSLAIRQLHLQGPPFSPDEAAIFDHWISERNPPLQVQITFDTIPPHATCGPLYLQAVPWQTAPETVQDEIWSRVLYFAMRIDGRDNATVIPPHSIPLSDNLESTESYNPYYLCAKPHFRLVSKRFQRLATPFLYRHLNFYSASQVRKFLRATSSEEGRVLASHVRSITMEIGVAAEYFRSSGMQLVFDETWGPIWNLLALKMPNLVVFSGNCQFMHEVRPYKTFRNPDDESIGKLIIPWSHFANLARNSGATLERIYCVVVVAPNSVVPASIWNSFAALTYLEWTSATEFALPAAGYEQISPNLLSTLETLSVGQAHSSFFALLGALSLPALSRVFLEGPILASSKSFLISHGRKLTEVMIQANDNNNVDIFELCPNMSCLTLQLRPDLESEPHREAEVKYNGDLFRASDPHLYLQKIFLDIPLGNFARTKPAIKLVNDIAQAKADAKFPALASIQLNGIWWSTSERDIAANKLVPLAEKLWEKGIKVLDGGGRHWIPRLSSKRKD
uniref:F-box domain-containing protein n=1 Tax=Mycena chlorophos TaxID=658473 RepID=A0ABQ0L364_MYCCL|nr:predicted protein [Mycena chlorophos]